MWLLWVFVLLPIVEIALFVVIGGEIGVWATLALVVLAALAGSALIRRQGMMAAHDLQQSLRELRDPARPMAHRTLMVVAGMLLIVPGFFTDVLALLLLVPGVRRLLLRRIGAGVRVSSAGMRVDYGFPPDGSARPDAGVIDGEYVIHDDPYVPPRDARLDSAEGEERPPHRLGHSGWTRH